MGGSASLATTVTIYRKLPYDPTRDFAPLALIARIPFVLVGNPSLPVNSVTDLIKLAKNEPGRLPMLQADLAHRIISSRSCSRR